MHGVRVCCATGIVTSNFVGMQAVASSRSFEGASLDGLACEWRAGYLDM